MSSVSPFFRRGAKPYVRWWWLSGPFTREDITRQLHWVRRMGFGGVELAWLHPIWRKEQGDDTTRPRWLGPEWRALVAFAKSEAEALGLGCDFTFGSCWPFGGSWVGRENAAQTFDGLSEQRLDRSWEEDLQLGPQFIVNHLSSAALAHYAQLLLAALHDALKGSRSALFCDSLEVETDRMWSQDLWAAFEDRFGYSLRPFINDLSAHPDVRYDYRKLIDETIRREFYQAFTDISHANNAYSRVQCHGAPADLLQAYASADIPESEALLFLPSFSRIAASAAAWAGKPVVSAEAFTCIYGYPGWDAGVEEYWKREDIADLKLLADALFAQGVNQIMWHGMPYQPFGKHVEFYASVHVGPDSPFAADLPAFNAYLERLSSLLRSGEPYANIGVYLPFEDAWMLDRLPEEQRTPGANFHWEMRHVIPPAEIDGYHPLWISIGFLKEASVEDGRIRSKNLSLQALYIDCEWLDSESLAELARLAGQGATLVWKEQPEQPGRRRDPSYASNLEGFRAMPNVVSSTAAILPLLSDPLLSGNDLPWYWARVLGEDLLLFFAHPKAKQIRYPLPYRFSAESEATERNLLLHWKNREIPLNLRFPSGKALLLRASAGGAVENVAMDWRPEA